MRIGGQAAEGAVPDMEMAHVFVLQRLAHGSELRLTMTCLAARAACADSLDLGNPQLLLAVSGS